MNNTFLLPIPSLPTAIVVHGSCEHVFSKEEKEQIINTDYGAFQTIFFSLKGIPYLSSECLEMILELRRRMKDEGKSMFFVEGSRAAFTLLNTIGISSLECFETLAEAVMSVGE